MNDRLDELLTRLPVEPPSSDLMARIMQAVARRREARNVWRRVHWSALASAVLGAALAATSWREVVPAFSNAPGWLDANALLQATLDLIAAPSDTLIVWVETGLGWQTSLAEGVGVALMLSLALLSVAAFGEMAQLLRPRTSLIH